MEILERILLRLKLIRERQRTSALKIRDRTCGIREKGSDEGDEPFSHVREVSGILLVVVFKFHLNDDVAVKSRLTAEEVSNTNVDCFIPHRVFCIFGPFLVLVLVLVLVDLADKPFVQLGVRGPLHRGDAGVNRFMHT